jgi:hypothetical protein
MNGPEDYMRKEDRRLHRPQPAPTAVSRRRFLASTAVAAGAAAYTGTADAATDPRLVLDVAVLNYLLKFEYIEAALYQNANARFTDRDFAAFGGNPLRDALLDFQAQEESHVATLRDLVSRLGATPLENCGDRFSRFRDLPSFLQTALALENIGVSAYLGILPLIRTPQVLTGVTAISSVESRHAAAIGLLMGGSPAPAAADTPRSRDEILGLLAPYIHSCNSD